MNSIDLIFSSRCLSGGNKIVINPSYLSSLIKIWNSQKFEKKMIEYLHYSIDIRHYSFSKWQISI